MPRKQHSKNGLDVLSLVSKNIAGMTTVSCMDSEIIVPTMMPGYNRATRVGGQPLGCLTLIHGPEQVGKSVLALALAESLRAMAGHVSMVFDSEFAGEKEWYSAITPNSGYKRTGDLNELILDVQHALTALEDAKHAKKKEERLDENVGCVFVVDTLTKLMPKEVLDKIEKEGVEKMYPVQAQYVSLWSRSFIPQLYRTHSSMIVVLQEREKLDVKMPGQKKYKVTLGRAVQYDNRLRIRVSHAEKIIRSENVIGMECHYTVENNKISGTTFEDASIFTSNGTADMPKGLDLVREVIAEGKNCGLFVSTGKEVKIKYQTILTNKESSEEKVEGGWEDLLSRISSSQHLSYPHLQLCRSV